MNVETAQALWSLAELKVAMTLWYYGELKNGIQSLIHKGSYSSLIAAREHLEIEFGPGWFGRAEPPGLTYYTNKDNKPVAVVSPT